MSSSGSSGAFVASPVNGAAESAAAAPCLPAAQFYLDSSASSSFSGDPQGAWTTLKPPEISVAGAETDVNNVATLATTTMTSDVDAGVIPDLDRLFVGEEDATLRTSPDG